MTQLQPKWCTVVKPNEYDINADMRLLVKIHNKSMNAFILTDVGKTIGLYKDWLRLKKEAK